MTIKRVSSLDGFDKATIYDEAIFIYYEEHRNDPEHVAKTREMVKRLRGRSFDIKIIKRDITPKSFLRHVKTCKRCIKQLRRHVKGLCPPGTELLLYVEKKNEI